MGAAQTRVEQIQNQMAKSNEIQRQSVQKQWTSAIAAPSVDSVVDPFWYTPWPKPPEPEPAPEGPVAKPAAAAVAFHPVCDPVAPAQLDKWVTDASARHQLPAVLLRRVVGRESAGNPCAVSEKGAQGLMQLMPDTAASLAVTDPFDPRQNLEAGARLLRSLLDRYEGDLRLALAAYNAGPGAVDHHKGVPPYAETQAYVEAILADPDPQ